MTIINFNVSASIKAGRYDKSDYKTRTIGTSDCNSYVPFYAVFFNNLITFVKNNVQVLEYSAPVFKSQYNLTSYISLLSYLSTTERPLTLRFKKQNEYHFLGIHRGLIYDAQGNILMCLAINSDYLLKTPLDTIISNPDFNQFTLFVDRSFTTNPLYENLKKKLTNSYIAECESLNIDIVNTFSIKERLFKNNYKLPEFKTVTDMKKFLKQEVPKTILL